MSKQQFDSLSLPEKVQAVKVLIGVYEKGEWEFESPEEIILAACIGALQKQLTGNNDTLIGLIMRGPLDDGDVPSKNQRGVLLELGLAMRVMCKGEQGFTAASYTAYDIARRSRWLKEKEERDPLRRLSAEEINEGYGNILLSKNLSDTFYNPDNRSGVITALNSAFESLVRDSKL